MKNIFSRTIMSSCFSVILSDVRSTKSKNLAMTLVVAAMFVACGSDGSASSPSDASAIDDLSSSGCSSVVLSSSSDAISSSSSDGISSEVEESSSSVASSSSERGALIPYSTECPAGQTCTYAPTEHLNPEITYGELLDTRDYQVYKTVTIGNQTWMAQNLNYAYTGVKFHISDYASDSTSWCYKDVADSCAKYGRYYSWAAAIDSVALADDADNPQTCGFGVSCDRLAADALAAKPIQGVCPSGWHLPSNDEWIALAAAVGVENNISICSSLKSTSGWNISGNAKNSLGFAVLPAGYRNIFGGFGDVGDKAYFWNSTEYDSNDEYDGYDAYFTSFDFYYINFKYSRKSGGLPVRCIKN